MERYAGTGSQNTPDGPIGGAGAEADAGLISLDGATTVRPHIYLFTCGSPATPADQAYGIEAARYTNANKGTWGTSGTAGVKLDPGAPASLAAYNANTTAATTYTASSVLLNLALNNRATLVWEEDPSRGLVMAASTDGLGFYFSAVTGGTALVEATIHWAE